MPKRKLTKEEIKDILSFLPTTTHLPKEIHVENMKSIAKRLKKQLKKILIYPEVIPDLKKEIEEQYHNSFIPAGESVGVTMAQSFGEKLTQSNLNTFHKAGSGDGRSQSSGLSEMMNATKVPKNPNCFVYFKGGNNTITELRKTIGDSLVALSFSTITKDYEICLNKEREKWYTSFELLEEKIPENYTDCISLKIDMDILFTYKINMKKIAKYISEEYCDMFCVFSPDAQGRMDIFVDTNEIDIPENEYTYLTKDNSREIYLDDVVRPILMKIVFCGIEGVDNMYFIRDDKNWGLELENSREKLPKSVTRFKRILAHPNIDMTRTVSNNIWDIYHTLGIEAVKEYMIELACSTMDGINTCHPKILVDKMTYSGTISSISRYSMRHEESGPLGKASFEETVDVLTAAGLGQKEMVTGVSASIVCGKIANIGTGLCELRMDMEKILS